MILSDFELVQSMHLNEKLKTVDSSKYIHLRSHFLHACAAMTVYGALNYSSAP